MANVGDLSVMLVGSNSSQKYHVGNIILGKEAFKPTDLLCHSEKSEAEVCGRQVTLVKAPGWLRGYHLCDTSELYKAEATLSVSLCPPGPHAFILVINTELPFRDVHKKATQDHMLHFFGQHVWSYSVVVFNHRGRVKIEEYIKREGASLQSLLDACGNRYQVLSRDSTDNGAQVKELFGKIDNLMAGNDGNHFDIQNALLKSIQDKMRATDKRAGERRLQSLKQREMLQGLLTGERPELRVLLLGCVFSGKSAAASRILSCDFQSGDRTVEASKQTGEVAGRRVIIVDTPGWWKFFPAKFNPAWLKTEILRGVALCSPSPNVILLAISCDTSFTEEHRRVTEGNLQLLGEGVWRHIIVVFTFMDTLWDWTIEQHIESEGKPLSWLLKKCGNRYCAVDKSKASEELLEMMEEMVAGNSSFYLSADLEREDPQAGDNREDDAAEQTREENTMEIAEQELQHITEQELQQITEQLIIEWDRRKWKRCASVRSLTQPPNLSEDDKPLADVMEGEEEQSGHGHKGHCYDDSFGLEAESDHGVRSASLVTLMSLLDREWSRREASREFSAWRTSCSDENEAAEADSEELLKSRQKTLSWLSKQRCKIVRIKNKVNEGLRRHLGAEAAHPHQ
ncbi:GTPase IMAP family member 8-like [Genypterus blacodes]|uniref:GTPase IMAP family member 8-like n=1 Tax=Genypterus blacodes TaxID=154954 RepID=UPI003F767C7D